MAGVSSAALFKAAGFPAGLNNTAPEDSIPRGEFNQVIACRGAENVRVSDLGKMSRRDGYSLATDGTGCHSGWSDGYFPFGLYVNANVLTAVEEDETETALVSGLASGLPLSYARLHDTVVWSNGVQSGEIMLDMTTRPWGCRAPSSAPTLSLGSGALDPGTYQTAISHLDAWGRESGARATETIDVPANGAIVFDNIAAAPAGGRTRLYISDGHGGALRSAVTVGEGVTTAVVAQRAKGRRCDTLHLALMPAGQCVAFGNGRHFVASGRHVITSPAMRYGLHAPRKSRVGFVGRVDMIAFVGDGDAGAGLYVADSKRTYFLAGGDPADWKQVIAIAAGAMPESLRWMPGDVWGLEAKNLVPTWLTTLGRIAVGLPGGKVFYPQPTDGKPTAVIDRGDRAALGFREEDGHRQLVAAVSGARPQKLAVSDKLTVRHYPATD